jgi:hypothetical protein
MSLRREPPTGRRGSLLYRVAEAHLSSSESVRHTEYVSAADLACNAVVSLGDVLLVVTDLRIQCFDRVSAKPLGDGWSLLGKVLIDLDPRWVTIRGFTFDGGHQYRGFSTADPADNPTLAHTLRRLAASTPSGPRGRQRLGPSRPQRTPAAPEASAD